MPQQVPRNTDTRKSNEILGLITIMESKIALAEFLQHFCLNSFPNEGGREKSSSAEL